jgi:ubiquinone/menaquinone biosynthesis C-methylase UbiE
MTHEHHHSREAHRFPAERRAILKDEERRRWLPPEPILEAAEIPTGSTVLDIGAGTGFWTLPLSRHVGESGRVLAVDIEPIMHDELRALIAAQGLRNVEVVPSDELSIPLPDRVADAALLGFVLHEPSDPERYLREVSRLLRPDARILIVDWRKAETEKGPPLEHRLSEDEVTGMLRESGFTAETLNAPNADVYILLGRRGNLPA